MFKTIYTIKSSVGECKTDAFDFVVLRLIQYCCLDSTEKMEFINEFNSYLNNRNQFFVGICEESYFIGEDLDSGMESSYVKDALWYRITPDAGDNGNNLVDIIEILVAPMNGAAKFIDWLLEMGYLDKEDISADGVEIVSDIGKVKKVAPKFYNMLMVMCNCSERA